jgi:hypothetical protein
MNYDLAVVLCLADEGKNRSFDEYVAGIVGRMLEKCPKEKAFLEQFSLHYYLADNKSDASIARVVDADYPDIVSSLAGGQDFAVVLNKEPLLKLDSEDSLAFVLGHELSHIMYQKGFFKERAVWAGEELVCDCNAVKMMDAGEYSLYEIAKVDALFVKKSSEMQNRIRQRNHFLYKNYNVFERLEQSSPLRKELFANLEKEPWRRKDIFAQGKVTADCIVEELGDIYKKGDRNVFIAGCNKYLSRQSTEDAGKLIMNVLAQVCEKFPPIDEVRVGETSRKYHNHPVWVMSNVVFEQYNRPGKKLYPPKDLQVVAKYMRQNRVYFEQKDEKFWRPLREGMSAFGISKAREI